MVQTILVKKRQLSASRGFSRLHHIIWFCFKRLSFSATGVRAHFDFNEYKWSDVIQYTVGTERANKITDDFITINLALLIFSRELNIVFRITILWHSEKFLENWPLNLFPTLTGSQFVNSTFLFQRFGNRRRNTYFKTEYQVFYFIYVGHEISSFLVSNCTSKISI